MQKRELWFRVRLWENPHSVLARVQAVLSRVQTGKCAPKRMNLCKTRKRNRRAEQVERSTCSECPSDNLTQQENTGKRGKFVMTYLHGSSCIRVFWHQVGTNLRRRKQVISSRSRL